MNVRCLAFASITLLGVPRSDAQNAAPPSQEDPVKAAIREFNEKHSRKANEVKVVLDPVGVPPAPIPEEAKPEPVPATPDDEPVLVSGIAPDESEPVDDADAESKAPAADPEPAPAIPDEPAPAVPDEPAPKPRQGLAVRVEKLQTGTGNIDPSQVKLLAPFPAKPLAQAPAGWHLEASENAPPITREVELSPGNKITLTVRPHLLVPDVNGTSVFNVPEPGFDASLGYRQNATVGAILAHSVRQLEDDSKGLGAAIDQLQQLLVSLPKPEPQPEPQPEPKPELKPKPKFKPIPKAKPASAPAPTSAPKAKIAPTLKP
jgi:hypothetical protein